MIFFIIKNEYIPFIKIANKNMIAIHFSNIALNITKYLKNIYRNPIPLKQDKRLETESYLAALLKKVSINNFLFVTYIS